MNDELIHEVMEEVTEEVILYALNLADDGRILSATYQKFASADAVLVEQLPTGETEAEQDIHNWLYLDGAYVYDPLPEVSEVEPAPEPSVWDELDAAYQEGYTEGVNTAYDQ